MLRLAQSCTSAHPARNSCIDSQPCVAILLCGNSAADQSRKVPGSPPGRRRRWVSSPLAAGLLLLLRRPVQKRGCLPIPPRPGASTCHVCCCIVRFPSDTSILFHRTDRIAADGQFSGMQNKVAVQPDAQRPSSIEEKLSRPLGTSIPASAPPQRPLTDDNLILQLDASPVGRATAPGRSHPAAGRGPRHGAAAARSLGRGGISSSLGRGRGAIAGSVGREGPRDWGPARPGWGAAMQPATESAMQRSSARASSAARELDLRCAADFPV